VTNLDVLVDLFKQQIFHSYSKLDPKMNYWESLEQDFLHAGYPSCQQTNSIKALYGKLTDKKSMK